MHSSMKVCLATAADAPLLVPLVNAAYRAPPGPQTWTTESHLIKGDRVCQADILVRIESSISAILVLHDEDGATVGCVHVEERGEDGYIGLLSVHPERQGKGLGSSLVRAAECHVVRAFGRKRAVVWVLSARSELVGWYERMGYFRAEQTHPLAEGQALVAGLSFLVFRKNLAPLPPIERSAEDGEGRPSTVARCGASPFR